MKNLIALVCLLVFFLSGGLVAQTPESGPPAREPQPGKPILIPTRYEEHKKTEGALGGSLLHFFRVSVDWPNAIAVFEKP